MEQDSTAVETVVSKVSSLNKKIVIGVALGIVAAGVAGVVYKLRQDPDAQELVDENVEA